MTIEELNPLPSSVEVFQMKKKMEEQPKLSDFCQFRDEFKVSNLLKQFNTQLAVAVAKMEKAEGMNLIAAELKKLEQMTDGDLGVACRRVLEVAADEINWKIFQVRVTGMFGPKLEALNRATNEHAKRVDEKNPLLLHLKNFYNHAMFVKSIGNKEAHPCNDPNSLNLFG